MKKLTDEGKVLTMFAIIMLWCAITSLIRDIYFAKRRERLYERRYWEKHKAD